MKTFAIANLARSVWWEQVERADGAGSMVRRAMAERSRPASRSFGVNSFVALARHLTLVAPNPYYSPLPTPGLPLGGIFPC